MKIITNLKQWLRARFNAMSYSEFDALCKKFGFAEPDELPWLQRILRTAFKHMELSNAKLNSVYEHSYELMQFYLLCICENGRKLSLEEQIKMATSMNISTIQHFPHKFDDEALSYLFQPENFVRAAVYAQRYALPEKYELELIRLAQNSPQKCKERLSVVKEWPDALRLYITRCNEPIMLSESVQHELLKVADEKLLREWCSDFKMDKNPLHDSTIRLLIDKGYRTCLREILLNSTIPGSVREDFIFKYPGLYEELKVADLCEQLHKHQMEKHHWSVGVNSPYPEEVEMIVHWQSFADELEKNQFAQMHLIPRLEFGASPYLGRLLLKHYPHLGERVYKAVKRTLDKVENRA